MFALIFLKNQIIMRTKSYSHIKEQEIGNGQQSFMRKVYYLMTLALLISGLTAAWIASIPEIRGFISKNLIIFIPIIIGEALLVMSFASMTRKISAPLALLIIIIHSILIGIIFSAVFVYFAKESIANTFYITAATFGTMSIYGYFTKSDLSKPGNLFFMGFLGLIIVAAVNFYLQNEKLQWVISVIGMLLFVGLTAYDTKKIKEFNATGNQQDEENKKGAILGALKLYLDFIYIFMMMFGKRRYSIMD